MHQKTSRISRLVFTKKTNYANVRLGVHFLNDRSKHLSLDHANVNRVFSNP